MVSRQSPVAGAHMTDHDRNIRDLVTVNSQGWLWPRKDGGGDIEGAQSCWHYMLTHQGVPEGASAHCVQHRVAVQAGGNCGFYVRRYAELFDMVYTFEPDPVNFLCLAHNVTHANVIKIQAALGDRHQGISTACTTADIGGTHVSGQGPIPTLRIDDLDLPMCDLIHLDIEGYELFALKGGRKTIAQHRPVIVLEYFAPWAQRYGTDLAELEQWLCSLQYQYQGECQGDRIYRCITS